MSVAQTVSKPSDSGAGQAPVGRKGQICDNLGKDELLPSGRVKGVQCNQPATK